MTLWHRIKHLFGREPVRLVRIEHGYFHHTRTKCDGLCLLRPDGYLCDQRLILVCTECGQEETK